MVNLIRENIEKYDVKVYAYCIMPNHLHLLLKADLQELASFMAKILAEFAKYYNHKHNRIGYVFQGRYKSQCVENLGYFWNCLRYIHNNALYIESVERIEDYKYSSLKELKNKKRDVLDEMIFQLVEEKFKSKEEFMKFHGARNWDTFADTEEEARAHKFKIACELLKQHEEQLQIEAIEILDYIKTRQNYQKELIKILHIPKRETEEIIDLLKNKIVGTG